MNLWVGHDACGTVWLLISTNPTIANQPTSVSLVMISFCVPWQLNSLNSCFPINAADDVNKLKRVLRNSNPTKFSRKYSRCGYSSCGYSACGYSACGYSRCGYTGCGYLECGSLTSCEYINSSPTKKYFISHSGTDSSGVNSAAGSMFCNGNVRVSERWGYVVSLHKHAIFVGKHLFVHTTSYCLCYYCS